MKTCVEAIPGLYGSTLIVSFFVPFVVLTSDKAKTGLTITMTREEWKEVVKAVGKQLEG